MVITHYIRHTDTRSRSIIFVLIQLPGATNYEIHFSIYSESSTRYGSRQLHIILLTLSPSGYFRYTPSLLGRPSYVNIRGTLFSTRLSRILIIGINGGISLGIPCRRIFDIQYPSYFKN